MPRPRTTHARSDSPITSWQCVTARLATPPSSASTSRKPRRRCMRRATGAIWRSSTHCRASRWRSSGATPRPWPPCGRPSGSPPASRPTMSWRRWWATRPTCSRSSTATTRRWPSPSAAWRYMKRTGRATASRCRWRRWDRSWCGSATSRERKPRCTSRSTSAVRFSSTKPPGPCTTPWRRFTSSRGTTRRRASASNAHATRTAPTAGRRASGTTGTSACC